MIKEGASGIGRVRARATAQEYRAAAPCVLCDVIPNRAQARRGTCCSAARQGAPCLASFARHGIRVCPTFKIPSTSPHRGRAALQRRVKPQNQNRASAPEPPAPKNPLGIPSPPSVKRTPTMRGSWRSEAMTLFCSRPQSRAHSMGMDTIRGNQRSRQG